MDIFMGILNFLIFIILMFGVVSLMAAVFTAIDPSPVDYNEYIDGDKK
jgi:hypothetical protein